MIVSYTGGLGDGKTLAAVKDAWTWSLEAGGAPIAANMFLNPNEFLEHRLRNAGGFKISRINTMSDLIRFIVEGGGIVIFDEIHRDLDSRMSTQMQNTLLTTFFMFLRKCGLTCLYTVQDVVQIDKRLKAITNVEITCERRGERGASTYRFTRLHFKSQRILSVEIVQHDVASRWHRAYNTFEFIRRLDFPSKLVEFDRLMLWVEEAASFARTYRDDPGRAWEAFVSQSKYTPAKTAKSGEALPPRPNVRTRKGSAKGPGVGPDTSN